MFFPWLKRQPKTRRFGQLVSPRGRATYQPRVETLEGRDLPSVTLYVVNTLDGSPAPPGSLRQALQIAPPGATIKFILPALSTIFLTAGPLDVTQNVSIMGPGAVNLTVDGGGVSTVFFVFAPGMAVHISGLTIAHGAASTPLADGGGLANHAGTLYVTSCAFTNNAANLGGGLSDWPAAGDTAISNISSCTFTANTATFGGGAIYENTGAVTVKGNSILLTNSANYGGGIYLDGGKVTVSSSTLATNTAVTAGGAAFSSPGATLTVSQATISSNTAGNAAVSGVGGGIANGGSLTVGSSTLLTNTGIGGGGGIYNATGAHLKATGDNFKGNTAGSYALGVSGDGGAIDNSGSVSIGTSTFLSNNADLGGGGAIAEFGAGGLTVAYTTFSGNYSDYGGGAIVNHSSGPVLVQYSTLAGNNTGPSLNGGGAAFNSGRMTFFADTLSGNSSGNNGGAILNRAGTLFVSNTTLAGNTAAALGGGIYNEPSGATAGVAWVSNATIAGNAAATGGGIYNISTLHTCDTIDATNTATVAAPDIFGNFGSAGFNLVGNPVGGFGFLPTDLLAVAPLLGPLAPNGGPTLTMALLPLSPAINAGLNVLPPGFLPAGPWDQRGPGFPRIVGGRIDIGAFEL
jgi:predicted outer membrane repeat protein